MEFIQIAQAEINIIIAEKGVRAAQAPNIPPAPDLYFELVEDVLVSLGSKTNG